MRRLKRGNCEVAAKKSNRMICSGARALNAPDPCLPLHRLTLSLLIRHSETLESGIGNGRSVVHKTRHATSHVSAITFTHNKARHRTTRAENATRLLDCTSGAFAILRCTSSRSHRSPKQSTQTTLAACSRYPMVSFHPSSSDIPHVCPLRPLDPEPVLFRLCSKRHA